jgi:hypothetical protein
MAYCLPLGATGAVLMLGGDELPPGYCRLTVQSIAWDVPAGAIGVYTGHFDGPEHPTTGEHCVSVYFEGVGHIWVLPTYLIPSSPRPK